jgi:hypothetical protein
LKRLCTVVVFHQEASIGERRNHNPDVAQAILCLDVERMMNLTARVRTEQVTIEADGITIGSPV